MQQDPFCYSAPRSYSQDGTRVQFPTIGSFHMQPSMTPWSSNIIPQNIGGEINDYQNVDKNVRNSLGHIQTPVSTSVYTTTSTFSWAHTVPTFMPWVPAGGEETAVDPLVRFTGSFPPDPCTSQTATSWELINNLGANKSNLNVHLKRKNDLEAVECAPQKQCLTEERMAARMKELHISNHYCVPPSESLNNNNNSSGKSATSLQQLEEMLEGTELSNNEAKSLILAPELKKLVAPEKLFASTFLDKVERPSMAVVVWQPPEAVIKGIDETSSSEAQDERGSISETNNNLFPQRLSNLCHQHLPFGSHLEPMICPSGSEFEKSQDVIMDT